ncbi:hypothetical protein AGMMS50218_08630 [Actinomycetota bacterium]|nr:hypothetical protein AGMMS50218_08630 [Actinomycetota bacterium]
MTDITASPVRHQALPPRDVPAAAWLARHVPARLRTGRDAVDVGHVLLLVIGVIVVCSAPALDLPAQEWLVLGGVSAAIVATVGLSLVCPWERWDVSAAMVFPVVGFGALTTIAVTTDGVASAYVGIIPLCFVYVGMFQHALAGPLLLPLAWATYAVMVDLHTTSTVVRMAVSGTVWLAISLILAAMAAHQRVITERLRAAARTDSLTLLGNRRGLGSHLARLRPGDCLVLCDLDHFKQVNDTAGHLVGDHVLESFGHTVSQHLRRKDYAARFGGEEFVLLLARTTPGQALAALSGLRSEWAELDTGVTFSAGVASFAGDRTPDEVLVAADAALYEAKEAGRDRFRLAPWDSQDAEPAPQPVH